MGGMFGRFRARRGGRRPEKKFMDLVLSDSAFSTTGSSLVSTSSQTPITSTNSIVGIVQGTGENQRIGRKCTITNIHVRFSFEKSDILAADLSAAKNSHDTVRVIIWWDKQCNGTAPAASDILDTDLYNSFRNMANIQRFTILYDSLFSFNAGSIGAGNGTANDSQNIHRDLIKKVNLKCFIPIEFDSTTGAITEIRSNNIGIYTWAKFAARSNLKASTCRIRFIDY